ncbi:hypothetical protein D9757_004975 [Collybiopsis confluens]|uniref:Amidohydrolase-related domain-containing protein n=1 Tax=Collybiopsis confluens TaxID=2823264 RepID=A0A8H5HTB7_9AGAR|nr:hypothetical protein D9757_004975 [Collybiopsis confluens]
MSPLPPVITLEEHYISPQLNHNAVERFANILPMLENLEGRRLADMDAGSVTLQVLSHAAVEAPSPEVARSVNDELYAAIQKHPKRLAAFAVLPMGDPHAAAEELARTTRDLHFVGALVNNHLDGRYYDDPFFWPVFERAQALDVPIYIHPFFPAGNSKSQYQGNFSANTSFSLGMAGWGWHADTGLHVLRLYASGLFEKYPRLKIVIGHDGELLPFQLDRIVPMTQGWDQRQRGLRQVWRENIWVTTSGMFSLAPFACLLKVTPVEHVMFSVDYPFSTNEMGKKFLEEVRDSGLVTAEEFKAIAYQNAERLLKVEVKAP